MTIKEQEIADLIKLSEEKEEEMWKTVLKNRGGLRQNLEKEPAPMSYVIMMLSTQQAGYEYTVNRLLDRIEAIESVLIEQNIVNIKDVQNETANVN